MWKLSISEVFKLNKLKNALVRSSHSEFIFCEIVEIKLDQLVEDGPKSVFELLVLDKRLKSWNVV